MDNLNSVRTAALELDAHQREKLVDELIASIAHDSEHFAKWLGESERRWESLGNLDEIVRAQIDEADNRASAVDRGEMETSNASDVLSRVRKLIAR